MTIILRLVGAAVLATLAGCGEGTPSAGGLTAEEERALDNAAAMLDADSIDLPMDGEAESSDPPAEGNGAAVNSG